MPSEDSRSLQPTLSPVIHASPLLAAHQELDGALPSCARLTGHEAETLQPSSTICSLAGLPRAWHTPVPTLGHSSSEAPPRCSQRASQPWLPEEVPSTAVFWAPGTAVGPPRQMQSLAVCCMNEEEKVRAARQLGTRIVPHLPVVVQPSSIHISSLYPATADTEALPGGQLSE